MAKEKVIETSEQNRKYSENDGLSLTPTIRDLEKSLEVMFRLFNYKGKIKNLLSKLCQRRRNLKAQIASQGHQIILHHKQSDLKPG